MIEVNADDAAARSLPPIAFSIDASGSAMEARRFPGPEMYLSASGPPGGPLVFSVWAATAGGATALAQAVQTRFGDRALVVGESASIELAGASRPALAFMTGSGMSQTAWCGSLVETDRGALLVTFGSGSPTPLTCAEVAAHPSLSILVRSFTLGARRRSPSYAPAIGIVEDDFGPSFNLKVPKSAVATRGWEDALADKASLPRALGALLGLAVGGGGGGAVALATGLADVFLKQGTYSTGTVAVRYLEWRKSATTVGAQVGQALDLIARGCPAERAGRLIWERSARAGADNDALVRTTILGVLFAGQPTVRRVLSLTETAVTHFAPRAQLASAALNAALGHALTAKPSPASMLRAAQDEVRDTAAALGEQYADITAEIADAETALLADLAAAREDEAELATGISDKSQLAFRVAFWELLNAADFASAVDDSGARAGDAATAMTGALLGAFYGIDAIPRAAIEAVLRGPPALEERVDFHPRAFLRVLARGFGADRDANVVAQLAPYVAIAFPDYADAPAKSPAGTDVNVGEWHVAEWLRGGVTGGQARCRKHAERAIATFSRSGAAPSHDVGSGIPAIAPLLGIVTMQHGGESLAVMLEAEPDGIPLSTPAFPLRGRHALPVLAQLISILEVAAARNVVLAGLRPEGIYVTRGSDGLAVSGVLPRADAFLLGAAAAPARVNNAFASVHLAPEVARGGSVTPAADVFSACSVFVFMTTRRSIYQSAAAPDPSRAPQPLNEVVELPGALDQTVEDAIRAGLDTDPAKRPSAADLSRVLSAAGIAMPPAPTFRSA